LYLALGLTPVESRNRLKLLFVFGAFVTGIEAADPMIAARPAAYIASLSRRDQGQ
jgi:hypothetical protein